MIGLFKWLYLIALAVWLGTIVFFSFFVAPTVFRTLSPDEAGRLVAGIFPHYYGVGYVCGVLLLVTSVGLWRSASSSAATWVVSTGLAAVMLVLTLYAGLVLQPRAHALREQLHGPSAESSVKVEFDQLHRRAVQMNAAVLVGGLAITGLAAATLRP